MILTLDATVILYDTKNINQVLKLFSEIPPGTTTIKSIIKYRITNPPRTL